MVPRVLAACAAAVVLCCAGCSRRPPEHPDVVLILLDTVRADHVGWLGARNPTTPHLDALAARSDVYTRAQSVASWTTPATAGVLSGRFPAEIGIAFPPVRLPDEVGLLPEWLHGAGYATSGVVSHFFVSDELGFSRGFDRWDQSQAQGHAHISSPDVTRLALAAVDASGPGPFFLMAHYFDPHVAYHLHPEFDFDPGYRRTGPAATVVTEGRLARTLPDYRRRDYEHLAALYDSEIRYTDEYVGALLDGLDQRGLLDAAVVVVVADHGEELGDRVRGFVGHGVRLYEESVHVPLLVKRPGQRERRTITDRVSTASVAPTLAGLAGVPVPDAVRVPPLGQPAGALYADIAFARAVVDGDHALLDDPRDPAAGLVFDLATDPGERRPIDDPTERARLRGLLDTWSAGLTRPADVARPGLTPEQTEMLEALGYADPSPDP